MLSKRQLAAITRIQQYKVDEMHEVKRFSVTETRKGACVSIVVGLKNDEGKFAETIREFAVFSVGPRGGITTCTGTATKTKCRKYPLIYGWH